MKTAYWLIVGVLVIVGVGVTLACAPFLFIMGVMGERALEETIYCYDVAFNSAQWQANKEITRHCTMRGRMVNDLIKSNKLANSNYQDLIKLLGNPDQQDKSTITYVIGLEKRFISIDTEALIIELDKSGKVISAKVETD